MIRYARTRNVNPSWLALLLVGVLAAGCSDDGTSGVSDPILGTWVAQASDGTLYLEITADSLVYYAEATVDDCADRFAYGLEPLGDNRYRLSSAVNTAITESTITAESGELRWDTGVGTAYFQTAPGFDPGTLTVCAGGGDDPALTCTDLPQLALGQPVSGELTQDDELERGRYYDVYGFEPAMPLTGTITLSSSAVDSYLYVYDAGGTLIAENDDAASGSVDAGLQLQLVPVCYRIEVTTYADGQNGTYTLRID